MSDIRTCVGLVVHRTAKNLVCHTSLHDDGLVVPLNTPGASSVLPGEWVSLDVDLNGDKISNFSKSQIYLKTRLRSSAVEVLSEVELYFQEGKYAAFSPDFGSVEICISNELLSTYATKTQYFAWIARLPTKQNGNLWGLVEVGKEKLGTDHEDNDAKSGSKNNPPKCSVDSSTDAKTTFGVITGKCAGNTMYPDKDIFYVFTPGCFLEGIVMCDPGSLGLGDWVQWSFTQAQYDTFINDDCGMPKMSENRFEVTEFIRITERFPTKAIRNTVSLIFSNVEIPASLNSPHLLIPRFACVNDPNGRLAQNSGRRADITIERHKANEAMDKSVWFIMDIKCRDEGQQSKSPTKKDEEKVKVPLAEPVQPPRSTPRPSPVQSQTQLKQSYGSTSSSPGNSTSGPELRSDFLGYSSSNSGLDGYGPVEEVKKRAFVELCGAYNGQYRSFLWVVDGAKQAMYIGDKLIPGDWVSGYFRFGRDDKMICQKLIERIEPVLETTYKTNKDRNRVEICLNVEHINQMRDDGVQGYIAHHSYLGVIYDSKNLLPKVSGPSSVFVKVAKSKKYLHKNDGEFVWSILDAKEPLLIADLEKQLVAHMRNLMMTYPKVRDAIQKNKPDAYQRLCSYFSINN